MENLIRVNKLIRNLIIFFFTILVILNICSCKHANTASGTADSIKLIHPDHIVFLWLENKNYTTVIGNGSASYINSLTKKGTLFTNTFAITHPSYPNYVDFFAGDPNGITSDACIVNPTLSTPNLFTTLKEVGKTFAWYSEDLPSIGSKTCVYNNYVKKHNPTAIFTNVSDSANKRFSDFPTDYGQLENVVCISPNLLDDMHDGTIKQSDEWVKNHLASLIDWCITHNSVFVVYFDESETNNDNRIPVIAIGAHVKVNYKSVTMFNHFSWTKTICAMFSAPDSWTSNLVDANVIMDCWR